MEYERQLEVEKAKLLDQRFEALKSMIESTGLRNANMSLAQELMKAQDKLRTQPVR